MTAANKRGFAGRRVVVIGSGWPIEGLDDIGRASALALAREGAEVAIAQPTSGLAEACAAEIRASHGAAEAFTYDPHDPVTLEALAAEIERAWSAVDVLVTHHVAAHAGGLEETTLEQWEETLRVNLTGVFAATKAFLPLLRRGRDAAVVHVGSVDGRLGRSDAAGRRRTHRGHPRHLARVRRLRHSHLSQPFGIDSPHGGG